MCNLTRDIGRGLVTLISIIRGVKSVGVKWVLGTRITVSIPSKRMVRGQTASFNLTLRQLKIENTVTQYIDCVHALD